MATKYKILGSPHIGMLEDRVNDALADGWELIGGASMTPGYTAQAIVKRSPARCIKQELYDAMVKAAAYNPAKETR
jgi:hypothetical protein